MQRCLEMEEFEVADHYAAIMMLFTLGLIFAAAMPVMLVLMPLAVTVRYLITKYLFLYSHRPPLPSANLSEAIPSIILISLTIYVLNGVWAFGVEEIFPLRHVIFSSVAGRSENAHNPI